ncbi:aldo/keto reductase [Cryptosporangium aurantiacum]|uniref:Predicted oxidoreductase n=1 Tax=Cryptosporangium aurantiacum TaxID=134849 RepID=A0A1M7RJV9_9ACTN|nr:aldo/keto reductase [Cryptosporangium aurantiacum]SHN46358.1 Predicted oxidoreductase [Cryptosporangium aurantiacum]
MKARTLGTDGPRVSAVGLGCMSLSWSYSASTRDDDISVAVIASALDHGVTFFDTADVYGAGSNEEIVGRALRKHRHEVTVATKVGLVPGGADGSPDHIETAIDASLYRLGDDAVDLYYLHRVDPGVPLAESWGAMASLVEKGKVRHLGLSEVTVEQAAEAHAIHPVTAIQSEFSLWTRDPQEAGVLDWCRDNGVAFVPFAPLGRGVLNGAVTAARELPARGPEGRGPEGRGPSANRTLGLLREVAARHWATPAQIAIAWVLAQGEHVIPIPGTKHRRYLQENVGAARLVLTPEDLDDLAARQQLLSPHPGP